MKNLPIVGLAFGPFFMVVRALGPQDWQMIVSFIGSIMLSLSLLSMYRKINQK